MEKSRVMVYKTKDFAAMKALVEALDAQYGAHCKEVSLFRRLGKYPVRVTAVAEESTLDAIEALCARYGELADLDLTSLIRESESMVAETGFAYIRNGGVL